MALERTRPNSHVLGIDILPAQPPRGVSSVRGNFLSPAVQSIVRESLREAHARKAALPTERAGDESVGEEGDAAPEEGEVGEVVRKMSYLDVERPQMKAVNEKGQDDSRVVDVCLPPTLLTPLYLTPGDDALAKLRD